MNTQSMNKIILALVCTICPSACLAAGGQVESFEVAEPIYADQTYTKTGGAVHAQGTDIEQTGLAGCVRGDGTIQRGSLVCPGY